MRETNYYEKVVIRRKEIKRNPVFSKWAKKQRLTRAQITQAADQLISGNWPKNFGR